MPVSPKVRDLARNRGEALRTGDVVKIDGKMHVVNGDRIICCNGKVESVGGETYIIMDKGGDGRARRAAAMRRLLAERAARRAAGLVGPTPTESAQEKVERLAREARARMHFREDAPRMHDVTGSGSTLADVKETP